MIDRDEIECVCGWTGLREQLVCSEEEADSDMPAGQCTYNICPACGEAGRFEDLDEED